MTEALKLKHVYLLDIQWKLQICLLFNIWRHKNKISAVCTIHNHFPWLLKNNIFPWPFPDHTNSLTFSSFLWPAGTLQSSLDFFLQTREELQSMKYLSDFEYLHPFWRYSLPKFEVIWKHAKFSMFLAPKILGGKTSKFWTILWNSA